MITPAEIKKKALRIWHSGRFIEAWCDGENIFPVEISAGLPKGIFLSENFREAGLWIDELVSHSKKKKGKGYSVGFNSVSHRQLGKQILPDRIFIETVDDFLAVCGKLKEFTVFQEIFSFTREMLPPLTGFIRDKPFIVLDNSTEWKKLLRVCLFFKDYQTPALYIRQIVIPGIDTKFIEKNKKTLSEMLIYLMPDKYGTTPVELSYHGFEKRFGLLYDEPLIRFRILDPALFINSLSDITLTLSEFKILNPQVENVFITENKINGLAFPMMEKSIVIFGLGYGIKMLEGIDWLRSRKIYYWGDIDTHGFSILSMVRGIFPECRSLLMDENTLLSHGDAWVVEPENRRQTGDLDNLDNAEKKLYGKLRNDTLGERVRLEQEIISFNLLREKLANLN